MKEPEAGLLKFLIIAVDEDTRGDLRVVDDILSQARRFGVSTLIANEDLTEVELYQLAQWGTMPHLEYPIQDGEIKQALREFTSTAPTVSEPKTPGTLVAIHGFLPNLSSHDLATEVAPNLAQDGTKSVAILDLNF